MEDASTSNEERTVSATRRSSRQPSATAKAKAHQQVLKQQKRKQQPTKAPSPSKRQKSGTRPPASAYQAAQATSSQDDKTKKTRKHKVERTTRRSDGKQESDEALSDSPSLNDGDETSDRDSQAPSGCGIQTSESPEHTPETSNQDSGNEQASVSGSPEVSLTSDTPTPEVQDAVTDDGAESVHTGTKLARLSSSSQADDTITQLLATVQSLQHQLSSLKKRRSHRKKRSRRKRHHSRSRRHTSTRATSSSSASPSTSSDSEFTESTSTSDSEHDTHRRQSSRRTRHSRSLRQHEESSSDELSRRSIKLPLLTSLARFDTWFPQFERYIESGGTQRWFRPMHTSLAKQLCKHLGISSHASNKEFLKAATTTQKPGINIGPSAVLRRLAKIPCNGTGTYDILQYCALWRAQLDEVQPQQLLV